MKKITPLVIYLDTVNGDLRVSIPSKKKKNPNIESSQELV